VVEHTAALVLRDAKINLEIESEKQGLTLEADPEVLKQVLLNLFINAAQATEGIAEKPVIKVRVREIRPRKPFSFIDSLPLYKVWEGWEALKTAGPQPYIEIEVQDNGVGIQPEDMSRIFVPFFTTKPKGTGLGLPICQRLIEGMGGTIYVKANRPAGTVFTIHLPVRREPREAPSEAERPDANPPRGVTA
jgi:signal transduction histidine kinase